MFIDVRSKTARLPRERVLGHFRDRRSAWMKSHFHLRRENGVENSTSWNDAAHCPSLVCDSRLATAYKNISHCLH